MIAFSHPWWLAAAAAWAIVLAVLALRQVPALAWIRAHVAPRFQPRLTRYVVPGARLWRDTRKLRWHFVFLFVLGALLIVAAAGPFALGDAVKKVESHTLLLVIDASLSMGAGDAGPHPATGEETNRFAQATRFASDLIAEMPDAAFGLISFSGVTVVHSPPTRDHRALAALLGTLSYHVNLTLSGTRYSTAFDAVIDTVQRERGSYQAVLLSDGELPQTDDYAEALEVLAELEVPVHTIGFGTAEGEGRVIYHPDDVMRSAEEKRVVREYHTRRDDSTLRAIAGETGGATVTVDDGGWVSDLLPAIARVEPVVVEVEGKDREDLSVFPLAVFLVGLLLETLVFWRRPRREALTGAPRPDSSRNTPSSAVAALLMLAMLLAGCRSRLLEAHWHNEVGVGLYETEQYPPAGSRFSKSMSFRARQHVPLYNLANNHAAEGDFAVAHDYYQEAMLIEPRLVEAHYNDGHALYHWGEQEIDREECVFERGRQLYHQAIKRFRHAAELAGEGRDLTRRSEANIAFIEEQLAELDRLEAEGCPPPPPQDGPQPPPPPPPPEGGEPPPPESGEPPPAPPGGGLSEDEKEQIRAALERIQQEAASASGYRQSQHQQITEDTVGKAAGMELWW